MIDQLPERIREKIQIELCPVAGLDGFCWVWKGTSSHGYGVVYLGGRTQGVHRAAYECIVGLVPAGLELDHLCVNPPCCNPAHLEPVTRAVNHERALAWRRMHPRRYRNRVSQFEPPFQLVTSREAAAITGLDQASVRALAKSGHIRAFRTPGGHFRYRRADVESLQASAS